MSRSCSFSLSTAALLAVLAAGGCGGLGGNRPSLLLITVDSLRPDALGCYGNRAVLTPNLDRMAAEGVLYTDARTVSPLTVPAVASIMTGLYPIRHSVRDNQEMPLPEQASTLAERAQQAGLETAAFVGATILDRGLGLAQGFDYYEQPPLPATISVTLRYPERPALQIVDRITSWLESRDDGKPFLLWVHLFDPHAPYSPPQGARERAGGNPYLGEVAAVDEAIGELRRALEDHGLLRRLIIVVAGDHGEGLAQHGEATHGTLCYDSTLRVPLIVRYPDGGRAGEKSAEIVSLVDLYPTLLETLGLEVPADLDGRSLRAPAAAEHGVYFESYYGYLRYGWSPITGWVAAGGKYLHGTTPEFFDPARDRAETSDRIAGVPSLEPYRDAIAAVAARPRLEPVPRFDAELVGELEALGYTGERSRALPEPLAETGLPDARTQEAELQRLFAAMGLGERKRYDEAIAELGKIVAANPQNRLAQNWLATYLLHAGRCEQALPVLRSLLGTGTAGSSAYNSLGHCLLEAGDAERALVLFRGAAELEPTNPIPVANVAAALDRLGRPQEAFLYRQRSDALAAQ